jgi:hypothetical protein
MGAPRAGEEAAEGASPRAIRAQIEETRAELADTLDALQEKLDPQRLKELAKDEIREATLGKIEPRLEDAQQRVYHAMEIIGERVIEVGERASAIGERAVLLADAAGTRSQQIAAHVRERAADSIHVAAARAPYPNRGAVMSDDAAAHEVVGITPGDLTRAATRSMTALRDAAAPGARALLRGIRSYPVTASLLALAVGIVLSQALTRAQNPRQSAAAMAARAQPANEQPLILELPA